MHFKTTKTGMCRHRLVAPDPHGWCDPLTGRNFIETKNHKETEEMFSETEVSKQGSKVNRFKCFKARENDLALKGRV